MGRDRSDSELLAFTDLVMGGISLGYMFAQQNWREILTIYAARQYGYGYEGGDENLLEDSKRLDQTGLFIPSLRIHRQRILGGEASGDQGVG
jgi:hypothetical protein